MGKRGRPAKLQKMLLQKLGKKGAAKVSAVSHTGNAQASAAGAVLSGTSEQPRSHQLTVEPGASRVGFHSASSNGRPALVSNANETDINMNAASVSKMCELTNPSHSSNMDADSKSAESEMIETSVSELSEQNDPPVLPSLDDGLHFDRDLPGFIQHIHGLSDDTDVQKIFWDFLTDEQRFGQKELSTLNDWRPFNNQWDWYLMFFWRSDDWSRKEWTLIGKFLSFFIKHYGIVCDDFQWLSHSTMQRRQELLTMIPPPIVKTRECCVGETQSKLNELEWKQQCHWLLTGVPTFTPDSRLKVEERIFLYSPILWTLTLQTLLPNWSQMIDQVPKLKEPETLESKSDLLGVMNTPVIRHWQEFCDGDFLQIRTDPSDFLRLVVGETYQSKTDDSLWLILNMDWIQHPIWTAVRKGQRTVDTSAEEPDYIANVNNNRFLIKIDYVEVLQYSPYTLRSLFNYGLHNGRDFTVSGQKIDSDWFNDWKHCDPHLFYTYPNLNQIVDRDNRVCLPLPPLLKKYWSHLPHRGHGYPRGWDLPNRIPLAVSCGFDEFTATGFAQINQKLCGYYYKILNHRDVPLAWQTFCLSRDGIPNGYVLENLWEELKKYRGGIRTMVPSPGIYGTLQWREKFLAVEMVSMACDKLSLDDFQLNCRSAQGTSNKVEGSFYRGGGDPLPPQPSLQTLDGRFLKNPHWWRSVQERLLRRRPKLSEFKELTSMEGFTKRPMW